MMNDILDIIKTSRKEINDTVTAAYAKVAKTLFNQLKEGEELITNRGIPFTMFGEYYLIFEIYSQGCEIVMEMNHKDDAQFDQRTEKITFSQLSLCDKVQFIDKLETRFGELKVKKRI